MIKIGVLGSTKGTDLQAVIISIDKNEVKKFIFVLLLLYKTFPLKPDWFKFTSSLSLIYLLLTYSMLLFIFERNKLDSKINDLKNEIKDKKNNTKNAIKTMESKKKVLEDIKKQKENIVVKKQSTDKSFEYLKNISKKRRK